MDNAGCGIDDYLAALAITELGPTQAMKDMPDGPVKDRIRQIIELMPPERECCGTFVGSPHRSTCHKYSGKFKPANSN